MHKKRISRLRSLMSQNGLNSVLITGRADILYYTGFDLEQGFLIIRKTGKPKLYLSTLFNWARETRDIDIGFLEKTKDVLKALGGTVGFDGFAMTVGMFSGLRKAKVKWRRAGKIIRGPRMIKEPWEVSQIRKAIKVTGNVLNRLEMYGKTESEIAREIDIGFRKLGYVNAFDTIVASGRNSGFVHHIPSKRKVMRGDTVVVDLGAQVNGYCCDITRTVQCPKGMLSDLQEIRGKLIDSLGGGVKFKVVQDIYEGFLKKRGYRVMHSVGHGVGLDVHEGPFMNDTLRPGMVVSIEPGIYKKGIGCRIEDMFLIKKGRPEMLSSSL